MQHVLGFGTSFSPSWHVILIHVSPGNILNTSIFTKGLVEMKGSFGPSDPKHI